MKSFVEKYLDKDSELRVLDLGSRVVGGQKDLGSYRSFFTNPKWKYTGADVEKGDNVDVVIEAYKFPFKDGEFDVVISGQTIEHMEYPWEWFREMARVLKNGGLCCIIAPAVWREHRYPIDTYRYYPDGMKALAKYCGLQVVEVKRVPTDDKHQDTYLIAKKP
jgi:SAM-dependent methyltransferase